MDEQPDIVSSGSERRFSAARTPTQARNLGPRSLGRRGWIAIALTGTLLICLGVSLGLTRLSAPIGAAAPHRVTHSAAPAPVLVAKPAISGTALYALPGAPENSFSVVALAVRPAPGAPPQTWLFVYGSNIRPGQRYRLFEDTCGGRFMTASHVADGTANHRGYLTIVAGNLDISPTASDVRILLYRQDDVAPTGGVQGPLTGQGAKIFRSLPPC